MVYLDITIRLIWNYCGEKWRRNQNKITEYFWSKSKIYLGISKFNLVNLRNFTKEHYWVICFSIWFWNCFNPVCHGTIIGAKPSVRLGISALGRFHCTKKKLLMSYVGGETLKYYNSNQKSSLPLIDLFVKGCFH